MLNKYVTRSMLLTATILLLIGCEIREDFGTATKSEWCRGLLSNAPTASVKDTEQTQTEVANIGAVIDTLCKED